MDTEAKIQELVQKRGLNEIETQLLRELVVNHMAEWQNEVLAMDERVGAREREQFAAEAVDAGAAYEVAFAKTNQKVKNALLDYFEAETAELETKIVAAGEEG